MTALHIEPLASDYQACMGPHYKGADAERRDELVEAIRDRLPAALRTALATPFTERRATAMAAVHQLAATGDALQFADGDGIDSLTQVIATLALQSGGVPLLGYHWCTHHALCEAVEREAA